MSWLLHHGDALEVLRSLPDNSFDALLSDPPAGIGFMGKSWDADKGGRDAWIEWLRAIMAEAYRCLKPGAHGLVWALPRTSHWTAMALEDAGFEVRDSVFHLFGSGFPKSLNASIAIDRMNGDERPITGTRTLTGNAAISTKDKGGTYGVQVGSIPPKEVNTTGAASAASAAFDGYGTALKPAAEVWFLIRKPLIGTVAANLLEHGTGCLAIDACRIGAGGGTRKVTLLGGDTSSTGRYGDGLNGNWGREFVGGRWPAHLILDEESARVLDAQAGECPGMSGGGSHRADYAGGMFGGIDAPHLARNDSGGPSRFFYTAKCSTSERNLGCDDLPQRTAAECTDRNDGDAALDSPRAGAGRTGGARNAHPTVKSTSLTRWLARLIKPPGDGRRLLVPFAGSGSEMIGGILEAYGHVEGIERELEYVEIARRRVAHAEANPRAWEPDAQRGGDEPPGQMTLFGKVGS